MDQTVYRATLLICTVLSLGVLANVFVLQGVQPRLAMSRPVAQAPTPSESRARRQPNAGSATRRLTSTRAASPDLIRAIQRELYAAGFATRAPDGALDMATRAAILAWERENGLPQTADASEDVLKALLLGAGIVHRTSGARPAPTVAMLVRHIQILLKSHGADAIQINGRRDESTRAAIAAFQRRQSMPVDGKISDALVVRLEAAGRHGR
jgi:peptidoglycan hydrolase-like protein with peptidoglycan-binding domain